MPKRFFEYSRTEPARTILFCVSALTLLAQMATLLPVVTPPEYLAEQAMNLVLVGALCLWGTVSAFRNNINQMSNASFAMFLAWLWSGLTRALFSPNAALLLWVPMIVLAVVMATVHIYMQGVRKGGVRE